MKNLYFVIISLLVIFYILISIRKNRLSVSNSFMWFCFCIILLVLSIWPKSLDWLADILNISYPPALFLTISTVVLFIVNFIYSKKIEELHKKVNDLAQQVTLLKNGNEGKK